MSSETHFRPAPHYGLLTDLETDATTEGLVASRSLITIRWHSIVGQLVAIVFAYYGIEASLSLPACLATVFAAVILNLAAVWHRRQRLRLSAMQATLFLAFDVLQFSLLLYLTGGVDNPFAIFLLAPIAVATGLLRFWAVASLTALSMVCLTLNAIWHLPLPWVHGALALPPWYTWVIWFTLILSMTFIAVYSWGVARETRRMRRALNAAQAELASANQMTAMGALAAAVAHELGTPLATISLVSHELLRDLEPDSPIQEDVELLVSQSERCRQVLADFARNPSAEGGDPYRVIPLDALVEEAASAHRVADKTLEVKATPFMQAVDPDVAGTLMVSRRPELVHGVGNIVQNAFQFAKIKVTVEVEWNDDDVWVIVSDDGPGFTPALLQKVGEPYISTRANLRSGHMGLGVFIAKTLLERTQARVTFGNRQNGGARVIMRWPRDAWIFRPMEDNDDES